jgi:hypothetical protein
MQPIGMTWIMGWYCLRDDTIFFTLVLRLLVEYKVNSLYSTSFGSLSGTCTDSLNVIRLLSVRIIFS